MTQGSCIIPIPRRPRRIRASALARAVYSTETIKAPLGFERRKRKQAPTPAHGAVGESRKKIQHLSRLSPTRAQIASNKLGNQSTVRVALLCTPHSVRTSPMPTRLTCEEELPPSFSSVDYSRNPDRSAKSVPSPAVSGENAGLIRAPSVNFRADANMKSFLKLTSKSQLFSILLSASPFGKHCIVAAFVFRPQ